MEVRGKFKKLFFEEISVVGVRVENEPMFDDDEPDELVFVRHKAQVCLSYSGKKYRFWYRWNVPAYYADEMELPEILDASSFFGEDSYTQLLWDIVNNNPGLRLGDAEEVVGRVADAAVKPLFEENRKAVRQMWADA
mgnify:CR=1 FL=1